MSTGMFRNAINISHRIIKEVLKEGDLVIDATCGRGKDSLFLARLVGEKGRVFAFDIQESAIESTRSLLLQNELIDRVVLINDNHNSIDRYVGDGARVCMFNLGYLPEGDHNIKTEAHTTIEALQSSFKILSAGGIISLVFYPGHPGGQEELEAVRAFLAELSQQEFEISEMRFINQVNNPPQLIIVQKLGEGSR